MTYPSAPWNLRGFALQTLNLVESDRARSFVPASLEILSVLPGKTLSSVYVSSYQTGSIMEYNELIVAAALVRDRGQIGSWISHIYVDNLDSVAGGREIWGLPKEMAEFTWENNSVTVCQQNRTLCRLNYQDNLLSLLHLSQQLSANSFSGLNSELLLFKSSFQAKINSISAKLEIPLGSPFVNLNLKQPFLSLNLKELNLVVDRPEVVGEKQQDLVNN